MNKHRSISQVGEEAFTLLEVLAALTILGIFMTVLTTSFLANLRYNFQTQIRYDAIQAAQNVLDELRFEKVAELIEEDAPRVVPVGGRDFSVEVDYCRIVALCPSADIRHIAVTVRYNSEVVYETDTIFSEL